MKWTKSLIQTLRENPGDAEIDSHRLLMRAGLARKVAGGLYAYLPLGMRSLKKIMAQSWSGNSGTFHRGSLCC